MSTYYEILEVTETASIAAIKGAYKYLSQIYHPDRHPDNREERLEMMSKLNEAYRILSNPELRREYDEKLKLSRSRRNSSSNPNGPELNETYDWMHSSPIEEPLPVDKKMRIIGVVVVSVFLFWGLTYDWTAAKSPVEKDHQ